MQLLSSGAVKKHEGTPSTLYNPTPKSNSFKRCQTADKSTIKLMLTQRSESQRDFQKLQVS